MAINTAQSLVEKTGNLQVPLHLRNAPTKLMNELGYGDGYKYSHNYPGNFADQEFLPEEIKGTNFFEPGSSKKEQETKQFIDFHWKNKYK